VGQASSGIINIATRLTIRIEEEASWKLYLPPEREGKRRRTRRGSIAVSSFATRMIQRERAGCRRRVVTDPRARALDEAARRWEARQTKQNPRG